MVTRPHSRGPVDFNHRDDPPCALNFSFLSGGRVDSRVRATELFQAATRLLSDAREQLLEGLGDGNPLVRHVAAIELAKRWPEELPETSIRELLETLARNEYREPLLFESEYAEATATEEDCGSLGQDIVIAFAHLGYGQADFVIPRLLEFWSFDYQFYELGYAMLALAFPRSEQPVRNEQLSDHQRSILRALTAQSEIWISDMTWEQRLTRYGLPGTRSEMLSLLGSQR